MISKAGDNFYDYIIRFFAAGDHLIQQLMVEEQVPDQVVEQGSSDDDDDQDDTSFTGAAVKRSKREHDGELPVDDEPLPSSFVSDLLPLFFAPGKAGYYAPRYGGPSAYRLAWFTNIGLIFFVLLKGYVLFNDKKYLFQLV